MDEGPEVCGIITLNGTPIAVSTRAWELFH